MTKDFSKSSGKLWDFAAVGLLATVRVQQMKNKKHVVLWRKTMGIKPHDEQRARQHGHIHQRICME